MQGSALDWLEERIEGQSLVDDFGTKYVPPHIGLFYCLGGIVLTGFVVQCSSPLASTGKDPARAGSGPLAQNYTASREELHATKGAHSHLPAARLVFEHR